MTVSRRILHFLPALVLLCGCAVPLRKPEAVRAAPDAFEQNRRLGQGVNLGNALDAPKEGEWGVTLKAEYFRLIREAGFDSVRIPVCWSAHTATNPPYGIDPVFLDRVDWAVGQALSNGLAAVVDHHHYNGLMDDPSGHRERFLAIWRQLAGHYRDYPDTVMLELLNEPTAKLTPELWNPLAAEAIATIRAIDPRRTIIVDTARWGTWRALDQLALPEADRNLIASFHFYEPFEFTHQGASWTDNREEWLGTTWTGRKREKEAIQQAFDSTAAWGRTNNRPIYVGEFGAFSPARMDSRERWTRFVREQCEARGFSWAYWEFCAGFGVYDRESGTWREPLLGALVGQRPPAAP